ncbi:3-deoxy-D-manno-octulosonic acid transferase [Roseivirga sp. BDSF3-8]|uniref:3-deoxy-D-manno-octulosonic acid transferase n=1 Tax=Roseivirga sp. BDSF3-8 TaxID=3241598 RepID=UPI00353214E6
MKLSPIAASQAFWRQSLSSKGLFPIFTQNMKGLVYRIGSGAYQMAVRAAAPFVGKARQMVEGRKNWTSSLREAVAAAGDHIVWVHCASLGEFEQGRPLIEQVRKQYPHTFILLTFFSPSGYQIRKDYDGADHVSYLPFDSPSNAETFLDIVKPRLALFVKYEFWYFYLRALSKRHVPTLLVSAIFRKDQLFFKKYGKPYLKLLHHFQHIFVQTDRSMALLRKSGVANATVAGDTRFDRVAALLAESREIPVAEAFAKGRRVMVAGSIWPEDVAVLKDLINNSSADKAFILATHEVDEEHLSGVEAELTVPLVRYSQAENTDLQKHKVLLIDNIGMLSALYRYGSLAYVGGAYGKGLHNTLEPVTYGMPVFFGNKNYRKFDEAIRMAEACIAFPVADGTELKERAEQLWDDDLRLERLSDKARQFVEENTGATHTIMNYLEPWLTA